MCLFEGLDFLHPDFDDGLIIIIHINFRFLFGTKTISKTFGLPDRYLAHNTVYAQ